MRQKTYHLKHPGTFLEHVREFQLGSLTTEQFHPKTTRLSSLANESLPEALSLLKEVDLEALGKFKELVPKFEPLTRAVWEVLEEGGRVFLCGCGATGRLSLSLEYIWRKRFHGTPDAERVIAFMAGGDLALVTSVENFEDFPEFGAGQLKELGFTSQDLLISCTEGGETPFVIGATQEAVRLGGKAFFVYCNPDDQLRAVERSREVIDHPKIQKVSIPIGPMAISGSTRLQACTVQMLGVGLSLLSYRNRMPQWEKVVADFMEKVDALDYRALVPLIEWESGIYREGDFLLYRTRELGITVLTDTTERSPTFSLQPFENYHFREKNPSLVYLQILGAKTSLEGWESVLGRVPRVLTDVLQRTVHELSHGRIQPDRVGIDRLYGYDFGESIVKERAQLIGSNRCHRLDILASEGGFEFKQEDEPSFEISASACPGVDDELSRQLLLKLLLNSLSNCIMARIGRYQNNIMTWVRPNNFKLIDRSIRYVCDLEEQRRGQRPAYEDVAHLLLEQMEELRDDESIVEKTLGRL